MNINLIFLLLILISIYILNFFFIKFSLALSYTGESHQKFVEKNSIPLSGGLIVLVSFLFYFNNFINNLHVYFLLIFLIGFFSDIKFISSPIKRFIYQLLVVIIFTYLGDIQITSTRLIFIDILLDYKYFSYLFVVFCIMILINGSNFIDGLNTLVIGYYLIVSAVIIKSGLINELNIDTLNFICWLIVLMFLYICNLLKKLFLGDGGAYLLGFIYSYLLIVIYSFNQELSPFFIVLLLWYPCFENLFSIIRKYKLNKLPTEPDSRHFHQLLFIYIKKRYLFKDIWSNFLAANIINLFNALIFFIGAQNIYNTQLQSFLILLSIFIYIYFYFKLLTYRDI